VVEVARVEVEGARPGPLPGMGVRPGLAIEVRLFASIREAVGRPTVVLELPPAPTAGDLLDALVRDFPAAARHRRSLAVAVNLEVVPLSHALRAGDEVALLPPVGGG
jgi:molybdopterin converting factor subunit 1